MAYATMKELLKATCDAIRSKLGITDIINHQDIVSRIDNIETSIFASDDGGGDPFVSGLMKKTIKQRQSSNMVNVPIIFDGSTNVNNVNYKYYDIFVIGYIIITLSYSDGSTEKTSHFDLRHSASPYSTSTVRLDDYFLESGDASCDLALSAQLINSDPLNPYIKILYEIKSNPNEIKSGGTVSEIEIFANVIYANDTAIRLYSMC